MCAEQEGRGVDTGEARVLGEMWCPANFTISRVRADVKGLDILAILQESAYTSSTGYCVDADRVIPFSSVPKPGDLGFRRMRGVWEMFVFPVQESLLVEDPGELCHSNGQHSRENGLNKRLCVDIGHAK